MRSADYEISTYNFGNFRLDGGAMFGSVPKNIWSRHISPDNENCIPLATRSLLVRHARRLFLIDVGLGNKWPEKLAAIYDVHFADLPEASQVSDVVLTHLHFDHAGGVSRRAPTGALELSFPHATHYLQKKNLEHARKPTLKDRASYFVENVQPLDHAQLRLLNGATEIYPGISVHPMHGHTPGQQWIKVITGEHVFAFPSDLIPTAHHLPIPFHMGYDLCAATLLEEKEAFLNQAESEGWIVVFQHDRDTVAATISRDARGTFIVKQVFSL